MADAILSRIVSEVWDVIDSAEVSGNPSPGIPPIPIPLIGIPPIPTPDCSPEDGISVISSSKPYGDCVGDRSLGKESPGIPDTKVRLGLNIKL